MKQRSVEPSTSHTFFLYRKVNGKRGLKIAILPGNIRIWCERGGLDRIHRMDQIYCLKRTQRQAGVESLNRESGFGSKEWILDFVAKNRCVGCESCNERGINSFLEMQKYAFIGKLEYFWSRDRRKLCNEKGMI